MLVTPTPPDTDDDARRGQPTRARVSGVVGDWRDTAMAGSAVLLVNGETWSGSTTPSALQRASQQLFGAVDTTMVKHWSSPTAFPVAVADQPSALGSGTVRVRFNLIGGRSDQDAGIVFGLRSNGEYLYLRYNTKDGNLAIWNFTNGERARLKDGEGKKQLPMNTWHELIVTVSGREVRGVIAGDSVLSVSHVLDAPPSGRVGLWVKRDAITAFRDFSAK
jgi:hypothetical protein